MKQFLLTLAGVFAGLFLFFVILPFGVIFSIVASAARPAPTPANSVLQLDLRQSLPDQNPPGLLASLRAPSPSVMSIEESLRAPEGGMAPGEADELRGAFRHFRAAGKSVIAHSQGLYPDGVVTSTYELGE